MERILVAGGAGFIGSHLCERLLKEGNEIICIDNYITGRVENVKHLLTHESFKLIRHDIVEPIDLEVDKIYNLACPASVKHYTGNPIKTLKTSFIGALNMLDLAKKTKARILQASTSEIYGDPLIHPQHEDYLGNVNPIGIRSCYEEGKRVAETLFMEYHRQFDLDTRIIRIFNTYGPKMAIDDGRVVVNFIIQALKGEDITVYGDGSQTRSFCYIHDLVDGIIKAMESDRGPSGAINLGNPEEYSIKELAELIVDMTNSKSTIVYRDLPEDDPQKRKPDISIAKIRLQWEPKISLCDGILRTIEYYKKELAHI